MSRRYVISDVQSLAGAYIIKERQAPGRVVAIVWSRRLARMIRDALNAAAPSGERAHAACIEEQA